MIGKAFKNGSKSEDLPKDNYFSEAFEEKATKHQQKKSSFLPLLGQFRELFDRLFIVK